MKSIHRLLCLLSALLLLLSLTALLACQDTSPPEDGGKEPLPDDLPPAEEVIPDYYFARGPGSEFVPTAHYPADDLIICTVNVLNCGAKADGKKDCTKAFQTALDAAAARGGGTVYVPEGRYYIAGQLRIPDSVVLCGDWVSPEEAPAGSRGTVLITDYQSRTPQAQYALIVLGSSSGLRNVTVYHKDLQPESLRKSAPTVAAITESQPSVENVTILNAYTGISLGNEKNANCSLAGLVNVYISARREGVICNNSYDITRMENLHVSPRYLAENVIEPLDDQQKDALYDDTFANCTGVILYRGDATGLYDTYLAECHIGILLAEDPNGNGVTSGAITKTEIRNCDIGVMVEGAHGIGTALTGFRASADRRCEAAIRTGEKYTYGTKVENGEITGKYLNAALLDGKATLTFTDMRFDLETEDYVFYATAGTVCSIGCEYKNSNIFSDGGRQAAFYSYDCDFSQVADADVTARSIFELVAVDVDLPKIEQYHVYRETLPTPARREIVSIIEYGARAGGKTDCTEAIQNALDAMAAKGGGIVLVPTGKYAVKGYLTVPSGVELAGMHGVWCYNGASFTNSCLLLYAGADDPDGRAAISLEQGSGLRGLLAWYPEQDYDDFIEYSYAVRSLGRDTYAINVNISNAYQFMDFGTHDSTGHYVRNCAGIAIKTGMLVGSNAGEGWIENVHLNQHQPYELSTHGLTGGYAPEEFNSLVYDVFMEETEYFVFGYNQNEHVLGAFGLGAKAVFRFVAQDGKGTTGTFVQCGADGCRNSVVVEQADRLSIIAPGNVSLGDAKTRTYITTEETFEGTLNLHGGAGFGSPSTCMRLAGGTVNVTTFTFASGNQATPITLDGEAEVHLYNCIIPFGGSAALSKFESGFDGDSEEYATLLQTGGIYGYDRGFTLDE